MTAALTPRAALRVIADAAGRLLADGAEASREVRLELFERLAAAEETARDVLAEPVDDYAIRFAGGPPPTSAEWNSLVEDRRRLRRELDAEVKGWQEWSNSVAEHIPESWDDDVAQEEIIRRYVEHCAGQAPPRDRALVESVADAVRVVEDIFEAHYTPCAACAALWDGVPIGPAVVEALFGDPVLTQHADGTVTATWPNDTAIAALVSREALDAFVASYAALGKTVETIRRQLEP